MKKTGFTLFELLVSISIIAILTALATISYSAAQKSARDARRVQDMQAIQKAEEEYYMLNSSTYNVSHLSSGYQWRDSNGNLYFMTPKDPKGADYPFNPINLNTSYCACALLDSATGNSSDQNCAWVNGIGPYYCVTSQQ